MECYDDYFGLYSNSTNGNSQFAVVAMHDPEDAGAVDAFDVYLERYLVTNVLKYTGISYDNFLKLPRDRGEAILKRCEAMALKEDKSVSDLMSSVGTDRR